MILLDLRNCYDCIGLVVLSDWVTKNNQCVWFIVLVILERLIWSRKVSLEALGVFIFLCAYISTRIYKKKTIPSHYLEFNQSIKSTYQKKK